MARRSSSALLRPGISGPVAHPAPGGGLTYTFGGRPRRGGSPTREKNSSGERGWRYTNTGGGGGDYTNYGMIDDRPSPADEAVSRMHEMRRRRSEADTEARRLRLRDRAPPARGDALPPPPLVGVEANRGPDVYHVDAPPPSFADGLTQRTAADPAVLEARAAAEAAEAAAEAAEAAEAEAKAALEAATKAELPAEPTALAVEPAPEPTSLEADESSSSTDGGGRTEEVVAGGVVEEVAVEAADGPLVPPPYGIRGWNVEPQTQQQQQPPQKEERLHEQDQEEEAQAEEDDATRVEGGLEDRAEGADVAEEGESGERREEAAEASEAPVESESEPQNVTEPAAEVAEAAEGFSEVAVEAEEAEEKEEEFEALQAAEASDAVSEALADGSYWAEEPAETTEEPDASKNAEDEEELVEGPPPPGPPPPSFDDSMEARVARAKAMAAQAAASSPQMDPEMEARVARAKQMAAETQAHMVPPPGAPAAKKELSFEERVAAAMAASQKSREEQEAREAAMREEREKAEAEAKASAQEEDGQEDEHEEAEEDADQGEHENGARNVPAGAAEAELQTSPEEERERREAEQEAHLERRLRERQEMEEELAKAQQLEEELVKAAMAEEEEVQHVDGDMTVDGAWALDPRMSIPAVRDNEEERDEEDEEDENIETSEDEGDEVSVTANTASSDEDDKPPTEEKPKKENKKGRFAAMLDEDAVDDDWRHRNTGGAPLNEAKASAAMEGSAAEVDDENNTAKEDEEEEEEKREEEKEEREKEEEEGVVLMLKEKGDEDDVPPHAEVREEDDFFARVANAQAEADRFAAEKAEKQRFAEAGEEDATKARADKMNAEEVKTSEEKLPDHELNEHDAKREQKHVHEGGGSWAEVMQTWDKIMPPQMGNDLTDAAPFSERVAQARMAFLNGKPPMSAWPRDESDGDVWHTPNVATEEKVSFVEDAQSQKVTSKAEDEAKIEDDVCMTDEGVDDDCEENLRRRTSADAAADGEEDEEDTRRRGRGKFNAMLDEDAVESDWNHRNTGGPPPPSSHSPSSSIPSRNDPDPLREEETAAEVDRPGPAVAVAVAVAPRPEEKEEEDGGIETKPSSETSEGVEEDEKSTRMANRVGRKFAGMLDEDAVESDWQHRNTGGTPPTSTDPAKEKGDDAMAVSDAMEEETTEEALTASDVSEKISKGDDKPEKPEQAAAEDPEPGHDAEVEAHLAAAHLAAETALSDEEAAAYQLQPGEIELMTPRPGGRKVSEFAKLRPVGGGGNDLSARVAQAKTEIEGETGLNFNSGSMDEDEDDEYLSFDERVARALAAADYASELSSRATGASGEATTTRPLQPGEIELVTPRLAPPPLPMDYEERKKNRMAVAAGWTWQGRKQEQGPQGEEKHTQGNESDEEERGNYDAADGMSAVFADDADSPPPAKEASASSPDTEKPSVNADTANDNADRQMPPVSSDWADATRATMAPPKRPSFLGGGPPRQQPPPPQPETPASRNPPPTPVADAPAVDPAVDGGMLAADDHRPEPDAEREADSAKASAAAAKAAAEAAAAEFADAASDAQAKKAEADEVAAERAAAAANAKAKQEEAAAAAADVEREFAAAAAAHAEEGKGNGANDAVKNGEVKNGKVKNGAEKNGGGNRTSSFAPPAQLDANNAAIDEAFPDDKEKNGFAAESEENGVPPEADAEASSGASLDSFEADALMPAVPLAEKEPPKKRRGRWSQMQDPELKRSRARRTSSEATTDYRLVVDERTGAGQVTSGLGGMRKTLAMMRNAPYGVFGDHA